MRPGLRSQGDARCSDEPRDRGTDGDTARTRTASTAQTRPMSSGRLYPSGQNTNYKFLGAQAASFEVGRASLEAGCMHLFECEATFEAEPAEVWKVWTDVERWPEWDVSKEIARLDGPFQPGVCGWAKQRGNLGGPFTITAVDDGRRWVTECPIPLGKVVFDHLLEPAAEGHVRVVKRVEVYGGFGSLLRLIAPKMRRDITQSLAALERQLSALGTRRHGHQVHGFGPSQSTKRHVLRASVDVRQGSFSRAGGYLESPLSLPRLTRRSATLTCS